jgi:hypothetical protein
MKRIALVLLLTLAVAGYAAAQVTSPTADVLGAHNVYGRGCEACHAVHSGAAGNGGPSSSNSGNLALWGEDLTPLYGQTLTFAGGATVSIPNYGTPLKDPTVNGVAPTGLPGSASDGTFVIAACLSCHDGNLAKVGMMKGTTVETVTIASKSFNPPTLLGNDGSTLGNYLNDHPVGPNANPWCGTYGWDCTTNADGSMTPGTNETIYFGNYFDTTKTGPLSALVKVAGSHTVSFGTATMNFTNSWITCTTCHDQHDMQYFDTTGNGTVIKPTHFFVRGWYDPGNTNTSNSAAQFCRSCHGGESNEMHGQSVPTT